MSQRFQFPSPILRGLPRLPGACTLRLLAQMHAVVTLRVSFRRVFPTRCATWRTSFTSWQRKSPSRVQRSSRHLHVTVGISGGILPTFLSTFLSNVQRDLSPMFGDSGWGLHGSVASDPLMKEPLWLRASRGAAILHVSRHGNQQMIDGMSPFLVGWISRVYEEVLKPVVGTSAACQNASCTPHSST